MTKNARGFHSLRMVAAALLTTVPAGFLVAQQAQPMPEVKIEATRSVKTVGHSSTGVPIQLVSLSHQVSYADLDLATSAGAQTLQKRISDTAKTACKELDTLYPLEAQSAQSQSCVKTATDGAMVQANAAVAAAQQKSIHTAAPGK